MPRELHVHHAHYSEPDDQNRFAGFESRAAERFDHARRWLDQHAVSVGDRVGQAQCVELICGADQKKFGHPARIDIGRAPGRALYVFTTPACRALKAWRMMMYENAIAALESLHCGAGLLDDSDWLVPKHQRRLALDIPGHDIA